jgi:hypothetical protein
VVPLTVIGPIGFVWHRSQDSPRSTTPASLAGWGLWNRPRRRQRFR